MSQWYAYLREIPCILSAWVQRCPNAELGLKYIDYMHEEAPHPEYLVEFAKEMGRDPEEMRQAELIPEFTTPYFYYWLSKGHIVEIAAANNFGNERTNTRTGNRMHEATVKYYPYPSLTRFYGEHAEEEGDHANLGAYVLKNYAITDELQRKATSAAKKSLQLKIIGTNALYERFMKNWKD
jgi:pyrroloquinoline quinone (PQQ) biosynthesis protein C